jgi:glycosyltransferase involved in cell wall biosynthesis
VADFEHIAIAESSCHGLEHAAFNAALAAMTLTAYPRATVHVHGEARQLEEQQDVLRRTRPWLLQRLRWHSRTIPERKARGWTRGVATVAFLRELDAWLRREPADAIIFSTADPNLIALLKTRLFAALRGSPTLVVFHELLALLERKRSRRRLGFLAALRAPHPKEMRYLVLSSGIREDLNRIAPQIAGRVFSIELPSLLGELQAAGGTHQPPPLRFGFVGGGRSAKGLARYLKLVRDVHARDPGVEFRLVGSVPQSVAEDDLRGLDWSRLKLPLDEYVARIRALSHVIWLGDADHYRLVASASLADVAAIGVPVVCQRSPFSEHLFRRFGDIGWLCDSADEVHTRICQLLDRFPAEHDAAQRRRLRSAANDLRPEAGCAELQLALGGTVMRATTTTDQLNCA